MQGQLPSIRSRWRLPFWLGSPQRDGCSSVNAVVQFVVAGSPSSWPVLILCGFGGRNAGSVMRRHVQPEVLRAALEQALEGIVILDANLKVRFMNRAVRQLWRVSDEQADSKPQYEELVSDSRRTGTYGVPADELEAFIAHRIASVRKGDQTPQDIKTSDGRYIRSQCTKLPGGGRLLTYFDITDWSKTLKRFTGLPLSIL